LDLLSSWEFLVDKNYKVILLWDFMFNRRGAGIAADRIVKMVLAIGAFIILGLFLVVIFWTKGSN